jgi:hypothetical protein
MKFLFKLHKHFKIDPTKKILNASSEEIKAYISQNNKDSNNQYFINGNPASDFLLVSINKDMGYILTLNSEGQIAGYQEDSWKRHKRANNLQLTPITPDQSEKIK